MLLTWVDFYSTATFILLATAYFSGLPNACT
jgi:hypothetical protein